MSNKYNVFLKFIVVLLLIISYLCNLVCVIKHICKCGHLCHARMFLDNEWLLDYFWILCCVISILVSWILNFRILKWLSLINSLILYQRFVMTGFYLYGFYRIL